MSFDGITENSPYPHSLLSQAANVGLYGNHNQLSLSDLTTLVPSFPGGAGSKEYACQSRRCKRPEFDPQEDFPWRTKWQPTLVFLPGESHGQRSLVGFSPWGHRVGHYWSDLSQSILVSVLKHCGVVLPVSGTLINMSYHTHSFVSATLLTLSEVKSLSHVQLFLTPWTVACQTPPSMGFPGKSTGMSCHSLLQRIFLTKGSNPGLLHCRQMHYHLSHQGNCHLFSFFCVFSHCVKISYFI